MRRDAIGLQVTLDLEGKRVVVIGGDGEAEDKVGRLLDAGAEVAVVGRHPSAALAALGDGGRVRLFVRDFASGDLHDAAMVLVCLRDEALATRVFAAAEDAGIACWCCDDPVHSHLAMPALVKAGRVRVAISTGGSAPALASKLRAGLERAFDAELAAFVDKLGAERERILVEEPDPERRRARLKALVAGVSIEAKITYG